MQKVIAGIITYNPDLGILAQAVESISGQAEEVVIIDNGSANLKFLQHAKYKGTIQDDEKGKLLRCTKDQKMLQHDKKKKLLQCTKSVKVIWNKKNYGMAKALNLLFAYAAKRGYKWVLTLDQDSICCSGLLHHMGKYALGDVAVVGPNVIYKGNEAFCCPVIEKTKRVPWVITSGSLTNVDVWRHIGGFDEKLFIDGVDKDFCLRAVRENYAVYKDYGVWILHGLGNLKCKKVAGRVIYVTNHEPWRVYYMVRNAVYLDAKLRLREGRADICKIIIKILLFEKKKLSKLGAVLHGIADGVSVKLLFMGQECA